MAKVYVCRGNVGKVYEAVCDVRDLGISPLVPLMDQKLNVGPAELVTVIGVENGVERSVTRMAKGDFVKKHGNPDPTVTLRTAWVYTKHSELEQPEKRFWGGMESILTNLQATGDPWYVDLMARGEHNILTAAQVRDLNRTQTPSARGQYLWNFSQLHAHGLI